MDLTFNCKNGSLIWGFLAHIHLASIYILFNGGGLAALLIEEEDKQQEEESGSPQLNSVLVANHIQHLIINI